MDEAAREAHWELFAEKGVGLITPDGDLLATDLMCHTHQLGELDEDGLVSEELSGMLALYHAARWGGGPDDHDRADTAWRLIWERAYHEGYIRVVGEGCELEAYGDAGRIRRNARTLKLCAQMASDPDDPHAKPVVRAMAAVHHPWTPGGVAAELDRFAEAQDYDNTSLNYHGPVAV